MKISPILPRRPIVSRSDRRLYYNESKRLSKLLLPIITTFLTEVFEGEEFYTILYRMGNELWVRTCEQIRTLRPKLKICEPNEHFFEMTYSPLENENMRIFVLDKFLKMLRNGLDED